ncbi:MAG: tripartite tricarboxylate transporter TctB family protein [Burkholderiales bacterium]|nr:tripartite tricarboxylate transporter TctB family protein [Burkholderiales bacterium]
MAMIRNQKDFGAGLLYIAFGAVGFYIARDYGMGTASRMGPGYFPTVLSVLLMAFGLASAIRSFLTKEEAQVGKFAWKAAAFILGATVLFGLLLTRAGLVIALVVLCLVSAAGSQSFKLEWKATGLLVILVTFCALVFAEGLGVPMPLLGTWFGG